MAYIVYCDESAKDGPYYSNFYGGAVIVQDSNEIISALENKKLQLGFGGEIKWQKVTEPYLYKYIEMMDFFFSFVIENRIKIRVMFTQNFRPATGLTKEQKEQEYFLLYYQFFKHAFGFKYCSSGESARLKIFFDQLPDKHEKNREFKEFIYRLQYTEDFCDSIIIDYDDIGEATSHDHVILQCMDIILGAMNFRLNELHKAKPQGSRKRGKRTIAKEKLYKFINNKICVIKPHFNIGISTGKDCIEDLWNHPYRHWMFVPTNHTFDYSKTKSRK